MRKPEYRVDDVVRKLGRCKTRHGALKALGVSYRTLQRWASQNRKIKAALESLEESHWERQKKKYKNMNVQQIASVLRRSNSKTEAAKILGCSRPTLDTWIEAHLEIHRAWEDLLERKARKRKQKRQNKRKKMIEKRMREREQ